MQKIGNILTKEKFNDDDELYNIINDINNINNSLPTLIINWEYAKELYPESSILEWEINENTYWTFSKRKRRNRYEEDIKRFKELCINILIKNIKYEFMDILTMSCNEKKSFISLLKDDKYKSCVLKNDMVFILYDKKIVYGVSLRDIDYKGDDRKKFLKQLYQNKMVEVIEKPQISYEMVNLLKNNEYILPYISSNM